MIENIPSAEKTFIGADLNAHLGEKGEGYKRVHGGEGYGIRNDDGQKTLESLEALDLAAVNTFYKKKESQKVTYKSGNSKSQVDFILTRRRDLKLFRDCKVIPGEEVVHQHKLVCGSIRVRELKEKKVRKEKKIRTWKLAGETGKEFKEKVDKKYRAQTETGLNEKWTQIKELLLETAEEICGTSKGGKRIEKETWWWSEDVQEKIKEKKVAFKNWQKEGTDQLKMLYKEKKKEAKRAVAKAKDEGYKEWYDNLGTKEGEKMIYRIARQRAEAKRDILEIKVLKDQQGQLLTEGEKIKERWRDYYDNLLNIENHREVLEEEPPVEGPIEELTGKEIKEAIMAMKKGKAAGCSAISTDMIKVLEESGLNMMQEMLNCVWEEEKMPEDWKKSEIIPIYKQKGDPLECGNYRGIKLLEHGMKILEKILERRLRRIVDIDDMQFGFMPGRGTTDATFILQQIQEKYLEKNKELFTVFVDLEKAYDRVPRELVYWTLRRRKVPEKLIRLVKATYEDANTVVRTVFGKTNQFNIKVGLHQGSGLSPFLFAAVLDTISTEYRRGVPWELLFADDLAIVAETEEELQRRWLGWQVGMESKGLKINTGKTEVMVSGRSNKTAHIKDGEGKELKQVDYFKYLGVTISARGGSETAVRARVRTAWEKWRELGPVISDKKIPTKLKTKLYTSVVRPVLLYGSECWTVGVKEENILEATEMRMLRRIKGVTLRDKLKSKDIRKELGVAGIKNKARESRLRWFGHVCRRDQQSQLRRVMDKDVPGKRPRGRPKGRWKDVVVRDMEELRIDPHDAEDRNFWRGRIRTADPSTG